MKVKNMTSNAGNKVANQLIINGAIIINPEDKRRKLKGTMFQSYDSNIAFDTGNQIYLDEYYWDYSVTTGRYRNQFLGETKAETQKKIDSGEYKLVNLN